MAANREPKYAPTALLNLTKTTLVDIVWELAGTAPGVESCDRPEELWRIIREAARRVNAPKSDLKVFDR